MRVSLRKAQVILDRDVPAPSCRDNTVSVQALKGPCVIARRGEPRGLQPENVLQTISIPEFEGG